MTKIGTGKFVVSFAVAAFASACVTCPPLFAQKRGEASRPPARTQALQPPVRAATPSRQASYEKKFFIFDASARKNILDIAFVDRSTDEAEFSQIYQPFSDGAERFGKDLARVIDQSNDDYNSFVQKYGRRFGVENDFVAKKFAAAKADDRRESLESLRELVLEERKNIIDNEKKRIMNRFNGLFNAFLEGYSSQRSFMLKGTPHEGSNSEFASALGSFEVELESSRKAIMKVIDEKFAAVESGFLGKKEQR